MPAPYDQVDHLVDAWRRERPDLDLSPLEVLSRVTRIAQRLERIRRDTFAAQLLERWEFDVLAALRRAGSPYVLSPGRLIRETLVTSGTMTNRVDRLVDRGLVERSPDPHDGRGVLVGLSQAGQETVDAALADLLRREQALLTGLGRHERRQLVELLRRLSTAVEHGG